MPCTSRPISRGLPALVLALSLAMVAPSARAQQAADNGQAPQGTLVDGFRSAKFGMSEDDVRQAISIDFHISSDQIKAVANEIDRTPMLEAIVPDVLPNGGKSLVDYVFGYRSHRLISAIVTWTGQIDPTVTDAVLRNNGVALQNYFRSAGYRADTVKMGVFVPGIGYVLFEGQDVEGHMTRLVLGGDIKQDQPGHLELRPTTLTLRYIADPAKPDIFRIAPGQF